MVLKRPKKFLRRHRRKGVFGVGRNTDFYFSDYATKAEVYQAARDMNRRIVEEGIVLLKNNNNALPMSTSDGAVRVSVFGKNSVNLAYGGSGSGGANTSNVVDLYTALSQAGFECNPTLKAFYEDTGKSGPKRKGNSKDLDSGDTVIPAGMPPALTSTAAPSAGAISSTTPRTASCPARSPQPRSRAATPRAWSPSSSTSL